MRPLVLRKLVERLGWPGVAGVLCLLAALLLLAAVAAPLSRQREELREQASALRDRLRLGVAGRPARDDSAAAQLRRFHASFPTVATAPEWLQRINDAARRSGIELAAGEYRLDQRAAEPLRRYAVVLPVRGAYGQIRAFVEAALAAVPSAALDDIELRRDAAADSVLEGRIRITLYLRDTTP